MRRNSLNYGWRWRLTNRLFSRRRTQVLHVLHGKDNQGAQVMAFVISDTRDRAITAVMLPAADAVALARGIFTRYLDEGGDSGQREEGR